MSKKIRVAINGFGRIGRITFRRLLEMKTVEVVAINDLASLSVLAHLFKYDSIHKKFSGKVGYDSEHLIINEHAVRNFSERDPKRLPWGDLNIDVVLESTGVFTDEAGASQHLLAGAKKVLISAPAKGDIPTIVVGINDHTLTGNEKIVSNASCTTNCLVPMVKVLDDAFGVERGFMTTIHSYTADQRLHDAPHRDLRRARAANISIVPTSTGAAKAIGKVLPHLEGRLDGYALRVPVPDGSVTDFTAILGREVNAEEINAKMREASQGYLKGLLEYQSDPIVSVDIVGNASSCVFDSMLTSANGNLVKVVGWYDNEFGFSSRAADLIQILGTPKV